MIDQSIGYRSPCGFGFYNPNLVSECFDLIIIEISFEFINKYVFLKDILNIIIIMDGRLGDTI